MVRRTGAKRISRERGIALIAGLFGGATVIAASGVLSGYGRDAAGDVVPFVLWANLGLGFGYVTVAALLWRRSPSARGLAFALAAATVLVAIAFVFAALGGTPVELRTGAALGFRSLFLLAIGLLAPRRSS